MNKHAVKAGFADCYGTYCKEAVAQQQIAAKLANLTDFYLDTEPSLALEVGCGSGFLTEQLLMSYPFTEWIHNDIAASSKVFVDCIAHKCHAESRRFVSGDAETMELPECIDLFASSSAVQWFSDLRGYVARLAGSMAEGGLIAVSSFGPRNLFQIRELTGNGLEYFTMEQLGGIVTGYFDVLELCEDSIDVSFSQPVDILRHLKLTGVNGAFRQQWTKGMLSSFNQGYEAFHTNKGYTLTYHPIYLIARKKR